ncbi:MAG: transcriptional regulator NrdR [Saccharofermentanaceae bacterium]|jgi:transcriptional repressor NrdR|nr:transcriptional repressor NrdR [Clostridia bacterium]NLX69196.1 transcriptional repressor NrdR [Clostridiaceae bacterium]HOO48596.1 transcriptional regulator NrdR [Saccharofermentans sp.]HPE28656.1 transcriptional regulator NrdR [Saccharofermentans sp.]HPG64098.1 transcriptional regulator NrdR [Saccharofermentans sp.]
MKCPKCGCADDKVIDTRAAEDGKMIRRRRECLVCGTRFTTIERMEEMQLNVIKKDGTRQEFQRDKILKGLVAACSKRPVTNDDLLSIVNDVEASLQSKHSLETTSDQIGEMLMERLKKLDKVAYVRFASVYRDFTDVDSFTKEVERINEVRE